MGPVNRTVDLTRLLGPGMPVYPGDPEVTARPVATHADVGYAVTALGLGTHSGTHVDAPFHLLPHGPTLDRYPVGRFIGRGTILDVRASGEAAGRAIIPELLSSALAAAGGLERGDFALLWTGWDTRFGAGDMLAHPFLTEQAAELLVRARASLVGTDALSVDSSSGGELPVHHQLLRADVLIVENLTGLGQLGPGPVHCAFLPLKLEAADGAPVRAVAWKA